MEWEAGEEEEEEEDPWRPSCGMPSFNLLPPVRPHPVVMPPVAGEGLDSAQRHRRQAHDGEVALFSDGMQRGTTLRDVSNKHRAVSPAAATAANSGWGAAAGGEPILPGSCFTKGASAAAAFGKTDVQGVRLLLPLPKAHTVLPPPRPTLASAAAVKGGGSGLVGGGVSDDDISIVRVVRSDAPRLPSFGATGQTGKQQQQEPVRRGTAAFPMAVGDDDDDDVLAAAPLGSVDVIEEAGDSRESIEDEDEEAQGWSRQQFEQQQRQQQPWELQPTSASAAEASARRGALHPAGKCDVPRRLSRSLPGTPVVTAHHGGDGGSDSCWQREVLLGATGKQRAIILPPPPRSQGKSRSMAVASGTSPLDGAPRLQCPIENAPLRNGALTSAPAAAVASRRASLSRQFQADQMKQLGLADAASAAAAATAAGASSTVAADDAAAAGVMPWWTLLPDFVPVGALAGGVDPRRVIGTSCDHVWICDARQRQGGSCECSVYVSVTLLLHHVSCVRACVALSCL